MSSSKTDGTKTDGIITEDMSYEQRLFQYTLDAGTEEPHFIMFRGLQRLNILRLQIEIAQLKKIAWETKQLPESKSEDLTRLLHDYSKDLTTTPYYTRAQTRLTIYLR